MGVSDMAFMLGIVDPEDTSMISGLLLPAVARRIEAGEKLTIIGLLADNHPAGCIALETGDQNVEILSIFVKESYRGREGGRLLLSAAEYLAKDLGMNLSASFTVVGEEGRLLEEFFTDEGFTLRSDSYERTYLLTLGTCEEAESLRTVKEDKYTKSLAQLTDAKKKSINRIAAAKGAPLPENGLLNKRFDKDLSFVYEAKNGSVGYIAVERIHYENGIRLSAAFNDSDNPMVFLWLLKAALHTAMTKYGENTPLLIDVADAAADKFARYIFPEAVNISRTYDKSLGME